MSKITNPLATAATLIVDGNMDEFVGKVYGVATALSGGMMTYDSKANDGKGRFSGAATLFQALCDVNVAVPTTYQSQIAKIARGLVDLGASCIVPDHDSRMVAVRAFCAQYVSLNNLSSILFPPTDKGRTLAAIVASMFTEATADKNGYSIEDIVAEVVAQAESVEA